MALFTPSKVIGQQLSQMASAMAPISAPSKTTNFEVSSPGFSPSESGFTPAKMMNGYDFGGGSPSGARPGNGPVPDARRTGQPLAASKGHMKSVMRSRII